jgi:hypothetical protein
MTIHNLRLRPLDLTRRGDRATVAGLRVRLYRDDPYGRPLSVRTYRRDLDPRQAAHGAVAATGGFLAEGFIRLPMSRSDGLPLVVGSERVLGAIGLALVPPGRVACFFALEFDNDRTVCTRLLEAAWEWATEQGAGRLQGPVAPFDSGDDGLLVDGFDQVPALLAPYHLPYYAEWVEAAGMTVRMEMAMVRLRCRPALPPFPTAVRPLSSPPWQLLAEGEWQWLAGVQGFARPSFAPALMATCARLYRPDLAWGLYTGTDEGRPEGLIWLLPDPHPVGRRSRLGWLSVRLTGSRPPLRTRLAALALAPGRGPEEAGRLLLTAALRGAAAAGFEAIEFGLYPADDPAVAALLAPWPTTARRRYRLYERRER